MHLIFDYSRKIKLEQKRVWLSAAAILLAGVFILSVPIATPGLAPVERHIRIEASAFSFSPSEIKVNPGDRVTIELVSTDVVHGLSLDGYDFNLTADPGQTATGTFIANKSGVFRFRCSVACGNLHPFMLGKLQVGLNLLLLRGVAISLLAVLAAAIAVRNTPSRAAVRTTP